MENLQLEILLERAQSGDKNAVENICIKFNGMVINMAKCTYIKGYDMEDLIQEGRCSVIKAIGMYDINSKYPFAAYVKSSVKKNFYNMIRSNIRKVSCCSLYSKNEEGCEFINMIASDENIEEDLIKRKLIIQLNKAMDKLPEDKRNLIDWYYIQDKSLNEYAEKERISYRTAVYRKRKSLESLKKYIEFLSKK
ncbi:sigma-70 family RNA polymerase sigma factor [Clostridium autoethanogenum]|uniref:Sigma-70 family RNA polymerase sigma factor n=1 Tax=Clostridium autoethanogenum TaxID=84023 RepID=A0A3M0S2Z7_9CLOT|nr:sigma-70 family RNA polymerase sigma factor [Clostridium autoethanogenum]RMC92321.1 sigma-70 family RNA polymerase sigma factor [Clostridium autoethanogenum]